MAIRLRQVNGCWVALCAVESDAKPGDIYLDDSQHYALSCKFAWENDLYEVDGRIIELMDSQKVRDAGEELEKILAEFHPKTMEVNMPEWLSKLLQSGAVWTALLALVNVLVKYFLPTLPAEILVAVNILVVAILAAVGVNVNQRLAARNK